ncbi:MAG: YdcF family protein [Candidatus Acidiferrales bacterium]
MAWCERSLYRAIRDQAAANQARPAGAIVVMGAAEYDGAPSPVYRARLDHAFDLEERGLAPWVITSGGQGGDPRYTEASVGRDYLIQQGVAASKILMETHGRTTYQSVRAVSGILHRLGLPTCIAVSDGFHLYRVRIYFASFGIAAYCSPAPQSEIEADARLRTLYSLRELVILNLWYLRVHV